MRADYSGTGEQVMTFEGILIGLAAWSMTAVVVGLGLGGTMKHCAQSDGQLVPAIGSAPLKKTA